MNGKVIFLALLLLGGLGYYLWGKIGEAPKEATLPGYTNALKADEQKAKAAAATANLGAVQEAINKYHAEKGTYPSSLQDLAPTYIDHIPDGLQYDANTGAVSVAQ
jgi:Tfp pilus assembly protein PilE